ncbi:hypothetical protein GCM10009007_07040 [Formosimonas limnophila]|uniref:YeeE/YedE family protein n=1 Tax=Formosimonas limnophila TaxID=1384487 RepID=A0A8J3CMT7_9BURK|nr:YeeE/YedE family protein [Formosimonas limnophila]GHA68854.1 hypothetical protein GCM10009007_07040 [Formosimonas limnophila]
MWVTNAWLGGLLIGLASTLLLLALGRIAGISGIVSGILVPAKDRIWRVGFVLGLVLGGAAAMLFFGVAPVSSSPLYLFALAGLLVGFGTVMGTGCTSGHGVCGLARRSKRSAVSVAIFMAVGMMTVTLFTWFRGGVS